MKFEKDLKFAKIRRNKKIDNSLIKIFQKAFSLNKKIFRKNPKKFKIIICDSEKEFKKAKYYYQKWGTATVLRDNNLITRSPEFTERIGLWKKKDFQNIINHEMNHIFWKSHYKIIKPVWLAEGLACHVGNNLILTKKELKKVIKKHNVNYKILDYRYLKRNFKRGHYPRYPIWSNFTRYIIKKYSLDKIIKLMEQFIKKPKKKNYNKLFIKIFGKSDKAVFKEFMGSFS